MKHLATINFYFKKYRFRFLFGILFVAISNVFAVYAPSVVREVLDKVAALISSFKATDIMASRLAIKTEIYRIVFWNGLLLIALALMRGVFMFFMRQTIIVMSRHIEFDQKETLYQKYQELNTAFYKRNFTGDLMNRMSEDVSRVRMYTGPAVMYTVNLVVLSILCVGGMLYVNPLMTICVIVPLPLLAISIYQVNKIINRKTEAIQSQLSGLTTTAQEAYSGIRVIKSFVEEEHTIQHFNSISEEYKKSAINLALTEAIYFPSMSFFIGLSMLITVAVGGWLAIQGKVTPGNIAEFVIYLNLLMFPISSLGWVTSMVQRAAVSQRRINEFLQVRPEIKSDEQALQVDISGKIEFKEVSFTYPHTGIQALKSFSLHVNAGEKIAVIGKTGSGKSTIAQLLLRMYEVKEGSLTVDGRSLISYNLHSLRSQISYAPQEALLFSDSISNNIRFGKADATDEEIREAARIADLQKDIEGLQHGFDTVIGERGVMLSGGQKQRLVLARAILKQAPILVLDECLSAVDTRTEQNILGNLKERLSEVSVIVITHRIFTGWIFDKILVLDDGAVVESGTHEELLERNGRYARLYKHQTNVDGIAS